jgi:hypothetical protein
LAGSLTHHSSGGVSFSVTPPAAERMRRHRERRREGMRCLWIELHETELDALVREKLLEPGLRDDPNAIADALYAYLERTLVLPSWHTND